MRTALILMMLMPVWAMAQDPVVSARAIISGPEEVHVGDLVVLTIGEGTVADSFFWTLAGSTKTFYSADKGATCIFASGTPGDYHFVLSVSKISGTDGSTVDAAEFVVKIIGNVPDVPDPVVPDPVVPDPDKPDPPKPKPEPTLTGDADTVFQSIKNITMEAGEAAIISSNYKIVASKAAGLSNWGLQDMADEFKKLNREKIFNLNSTAGDRWLPWATGHKKATDKNTTKVQQIETYNDAADAFDAYIEWKSSSSHPFREVRSSGSGSLIDQISGLSSTVDRANNALESVQDGVDTAKEAAAKIRQEIGQ